MSGFSDVIGRIHGQAASSFRSSAQPSTSTRSRGEGLGYGTHPFAKRQLGVARHRSTPCLSITMQAWKQLSKVGTSDQLAERRRHTVRRIGSCRSIAPCRSQAEGSSGGEVSEPKARRRSYGAPRPPLQRQRPGPQRPMDSRQAKPQQPSQQQMPQGASSAQQRVPSMPQENRSVHRNQGEPGTSMGWSTTAKKPTLVHFCLQYHTNYGQQIRLVGSHENLGGYYWIHTRLQ